MSVKERHYRSSIFSREREDDELASWVILFLKGHTLLDTNSKAYIPYLVDYKRIKRTGKPIFLAVCRDYEMDVVKNFFRQNGVVCMTPPSIYCTSDYKSIWFYELKDQFLEAGHASFIVALKIQS